MKYKVDVEIEILNKNGAKGQLIIINSTLKSQDLTWVNSDELGLKQLTNSP